MERKTGRSKKIAIVMTVVLGAAILGGAFMIKSMTEKRKQPGDIFLYGEQHAVEGILEKELELWLSYYQNNGMRDLFVELPYYDAEYLNLWMQSADDVILEQLYQEWEGTALHAQAVLDFYKRIKADCPETVFHGTDVGHQYDTTGKRFLAYLESQGKEQSETYRRAMENIEQGRYYYEHADMVYRENKMVENFIREYDRLDGADIMGIYGNAHTAVGAMDYETRSVPCMAGQLHEKYGDALHTEDLTLQNEAERVDTIEIDGKAYTASYFGKVDLSAVFPDFQCREFWRLEDAYGDFKNRPVTGNVLPYNNYPMAIEPGQVFLIVYTKADGTVIREYHRSDGNMWQGVYATEEFQ